MAEITIKALTDVESLKPIETLQMEIWGMPPQEVVPVQQLMAAVSAGGTVLAAFDADGSMVGFCYGFAGWRDGRPLFYSHMAGVRGGLRLQDVGFRLKCAQREAALALGYEHAVWTFDPLQSINAHFNLHKLGAIAGRYYVNYYGQMQDELNRGLDSDRLEVDWGLRSRRVGAAVVGQLEERDWGSAPRALEAVPHLAGVAPKPPALHLEDPVVLIEIPTDFPAIRQRDRGLAVAWRVATREAFLHHIERGYRAVDFALRPGERLRGDYVLSRAPDAD